jgi:hypothetical protein
VTGTVGNVVTVTGTGVSNVIAGARVSSVDYLAMGTIGFIATSPGEFYAGANSTGTGTGVILTAAPAATTRYWVGGTGTWDAATTTNWSTSSGGATGASVPTSADAVIFDSLSNATAYTVTCTATQLRCAALTFAGPLTGNVTWAGTAPLAIHGNFTLPATGLTRSFTGNITYSGSSTGRTITTNGIALNSAVTINGVGCEWTLADAFTVSGTLFVTNGSFASASYNLTLASVDSQLTNARTINLGSSTITASGNFRFGTTENARANLTFTAGTSQVNLSTTALSFDGNNQTFYNISTTSTALNTFTLTGVNTFNNLSITGRTTVGIVAISVSGNQTINGTLTLSAGTDATMRHFVQSNTIGTTRTLTCAAFSGTDADFRDITIAGAAAPISGTRLGDGKGNSGITFGAGVTKYWNLAGGGNWGGAIGWATSSGGSPAINNFPLAQDTCLFEATGLNSGATVTLNAAYNIGTIDMSARTSNTMTLSLTNAANIYGNWINGTLTISGNNTFANISNSAGVATNISMGTTTQTVGDFTASGTVGNVLTVQGTSATSPCTLIYTGVGEATTATTDYLTITGVRAYSLEDTWYAGANSTNNGSLGWLFSSAAPATGSGGKFFIMFG